MPARGDAISVDDYFGTHGPESRRLFESVRTAIECIGEAETRATKSQVAFRRRLAFAWVWVPGQYLKRDGLAPLVLTVGLSRRDASPRWKQVVEVRPGRFTHHMELWAAEQIDDEVESWLREAWEGAG